MLDLLGAYPIGLFFLYMIINTLDVIAQPHWLLSNLTLGKPINERIVFRIIIRPERTEAQLIIKEVFNAINDNM